MHSADRSLEGAIYGRKSVIDSSAIFQGCFIQRLAGEDSPRGLAALPSEEENFEHQLDCVVEYYGGALVRRHVTSILIQTVVCH